MRNAEIKRKTAETDIDLSLSLDGSGKSEIQTGCGFLDHMLTLFSAHARFDLKLLCRGDTNVDFHHTTEDIGIALGDAFSAALGDKRGISRYGFFLLPMDEALLQCAVDFCGRSYLGFDVKMPAEKVGDFDTELVEEFFLGFVRHAGATLHLTALSGTNTHHIIEGAFKCAARAMRQACAMDPECTNEIPSTKGTLA